MRPMMLFACSPRKIAVTLVVCLFANSLYSQRLIEGITQTTDGLQIPYVNISLGWSKKSGTVSNLEGRFRIQASHSDTLYISHIGFMAEAIPVASIPTGRDLVVVLRQYATELSEVIIMPDETLRRLLFDAYSRIEDNYPASGSVITGFYREANQLLPENSFLYFAESIIQFYKPAYSNRDFGPVRIVEGAKSELESRHSYVNINFFAGLYVPQRFDFVKERAEFIDPDKYDLYDYILSEIAVDEGRVGYRIQFRPKESALYKGEFYLDKSTLAYTGARYELSKHGIQKNNQRYLNSFSFTSRKFTVQYKRFNDKWNIYLVFQEGIGNSKGAEIRYTNEYVSTLFEPGANQIKESESVPYSGVFAQQSEKFSDDYWKMDAGVILRSGALDSTVTFLLNRNELKLKAANPGEKVPATSSARKSYKHATRLSSTIFSGVAPIDITPGTIAVSYAGSFAIQKLNDQRKVLPIFGYELRYSMPSRISFTATYFGAMSKTFTTTHVSVATEWSKTIFGWKRPVYLQPGLAAFYSSLYQNLGITTAIADFEYNNSTIPQGDITVFAGEHRYGLSPSIALGYRFRPRMSVYGKVSFPGALYTKDIIAVQSHPAAQNKPTARLATTDGELQLAHDGVPTTSSGTAYQNFKASFWIGLRFGF